jgi:hypothetical protein
VRDVAAHRWPFHMACEVRSASSNSRFFAPSRCRFGNDVPALEIADCCALRQASLDVSVSELCSHLQDRASYHPTIVEVVLSTCGHSGEKGNA